MDANWRPTQGSNPAAGAGADPNAPAGGGWRALLQPEARSRIVNKILETLKKHVPLYSGADGLNELQRIAAQLEEEIYSVATNQSDYLRKISLKMLSMETPGNAQVILNQNNPGQASTDSTAQTGRAGADDWQEETYQMIKSLKDQYFAQLNELFNKISLKIQQVDSIIPRQRPSEQYGRMKSFKIMLDRILQVLQMSRSTIQPAMRDKVPQYEKQIISILNSQRRKPVQPRVQQQLQPPAGQAPNSSISQQQQPSQSLQQHDTHTNPQASLSSMGTGLQSSRAAVFRHVPAPPTTNFSVYTQQNSADMQRQAVFDLEAAQGSDFNSWQYGSMGGSTLPMQGATNAQPQTSMLSHNSVNTTQPDANSMQANARGWTPLSGPRQHGPKRSWREAF